MKKFVKKEKETSGVSFLDIIVAAIDTAYDMNHPREVEVEGVKYIRADLVEERDE